MDETIEKALQPAVPGLFVRALGSFLPGVATTRDQISDYRTEWVDEARRAFESDLPVLVVLGDSLGQSVGASERQNGYVHRVASDLGSHGTDFKILNLSRSGARIDDVLNIQLPALRASGVQVLAGMCTIGSNDLVRSWRIGRIRASLTTLLETLPDELVIATLPDAKSMTAKSMNRYLRREAERVQRPVADVAASLTSLRGRMAGDGFHPNDAGYEIWAQAFLDVLVPRLTASRRG